MGCLVSTGVVAPSAAASAYRRLKSVMQFFLSIVFCTRNRPIELKRALVSLQVDAHSVADTECELVIVDDGALEPEYLDAVRSQADADGWGRRPGGRTTSRLPPT